MSKEKKTIILSIMGVAIFIALIVSVSYAYYTKSVGISGDNSVNIKASELSISYEDTSKDVIDVKMVPGDHFTKTFTVTNNGGNTKFQIYVEDLVNEFISYSDITYTIKEGTTPLVSDKVFPHLANASDLSEAITIAGGETKEYTLTVTYNNTEDDQKPDMGHKISGKIFIKSA